MEPWSDRSADLYEFVFSRDDAHRHAERLHEIIEERAPGMRTLLDVASEPVGTWSGSATGTRSKGSTPRPACFATRSGGYQARPYIKPT